MVLNDCDIDKAGEPEDLRKKCCSVKELDLAQNKLQNWNEVFAILSHMPRVEFVNLSLNRLCGPVQRPPEYGMTRIRSLVLNNTRLDWDSVETIINLMPVLEELHLSLNDYRNVLIDTLDDYVDNDLVMDIDEDSNSSGGSGSGGGGGDASCTCGTGTIPTAAKRSKFSGNYVQLYWQNVWWEFFLNF